MEQDTLYLLLHPRTKAELFMDKKAKAQVQHLSTSYTIPHIDVNDLCNISGLNYKVSHKKV